MVCVCYALFVFFWFSSTLVIPIPVAAASVLDTFIELCLKFSSPLGRENAAQPLRLGGEGKWQKEVSAVPVTLIQQLMHKRVLILARVKVLSTGRCSQHVSDEMWAPTEHTCSWGDKVWVLTQHVCS